MIAIEGAYRICGDCKLNLPLWKYGKNKNRPDGRTQYCKPCHNKRNKASYIKNHGGTRNYHLVRRYGITATQVDAMIVAQDGRCAVCREGDAKHVDHDHDTGKVRGILCHGCNTGMGNFSDDPRRLRLAAEFIELHREQ